MRAPKKGSLLRELPIIIVSALVVSIIVKTFFIHFFFIPSGSMENTLQVGDRIAVNKLASYFSEIKRGEVVVFRDPAGWLGSPSPSSDPKAIQKIKSGLVTVGVLPDPAKQYLIKRVIGVGGDTVTCCDKKGFLTVNGISVSELEKVKNKAESALAFEDMSLMNRASNIAMYENLGEAELINTAAARPRGLVLR